MKILLIGGTGTISSAITQQLAGSHHEVWMLNRGLRQVQMPENVRNIIADINDEAAVKALIANEMFDAVCEFIAFVPEHVERDFRLFSGHTRQYVFISSASAYHKPSRNYIITEGTSLVNPHWEYSRQKARCEDVLMKHYHHDHFPVTIVRPSHTYNERGVPVGLHGPKGCWQVLQRMIDGKPVIVHGDGSSLWTLTWNGDFARGFIGLLGNPHAIGEAFHITSDESLTWNQIYASIAQTLGVDYKPYHVSSSFLAAVAPKAYDVEGNLLGDKAVTVVFDNTKLKRAVPGFQATTRFDVGVRQSIDYLLSHPEMQVSDPEFDQWCDRVIECQEQAKRQFRNP